ncbi:MAG TPA: hypothetical protein DIC18_04350 [Clostridiales bacterium]|nr:hypothetical protein [Clostridiales bacterium]
MELIDIRGNETVWEEYEDLLDHLKKEKATAIEAEKQRKAKEKLEQEQRAKAEAERKRREESLLRAKIEQRSKRNKSIVVLTIMLLIYSAVAVGQVFLLKGTWQIKAPNWLLTHTVHIYHWMAWWDRASTFIGMILAFPVEVVVWLLAVISFPFRWLISRILGLVFYLLYFVAPLVPGVFATSTVGIESISGGSIKHKGVGIFGLVFTIATGLTVAILCWSVFYPEAFASLKH